MAGIKQVNLHVPEFRRDQIHRRAEANGQKVIDYILTLVDQEESLAKGQTILITNPSKISNKTLMEIVANG